MSNETSLPTSNPKKESGVSRRRFIGHGAVLAAASMAGRLPHWSNSSETTLREGPLQPQVNVLDNLPKQPESQDQEEKMMSDFNNLLLECFTQKGADTLKNNVGLSDKMLKAKEENTRDERLWTLYEEDRPHFPVYIRQDGVNIDGARQVIERIRLNTGYIGRLEEFKDAVVPLMSQKGVMFETVKDPGTVEIETPETQLTSQSEQFDDGMNISYLAVLKPKHELVKDLSGDEYGAVDLVLRLGSEGILSLEKTVTYLNNPKKAAA